MTFFVGFLLVVIVGGYILYPLWVKEIKFVQLKEQLYSVEEHIEKEIQALRDHSNTQK